MKSGGKIVVFDMDGVLVDIESSWLFVHNALHVSSIDNFNRYLRREFDYREFMRRDIRLWGHIHVSAVEKILARVPIMKGARLTVTRLKRSGFKTAILTSGISILAERVQRELGLDISLANRLLFDEDGMLTGEGEEIVPLLDKIVVLKKLVSDCQTTLDNCVVIGDSQFDIPLFKEAGFSIAFNARDERVRQAATVVIENKDLARILPHFLGGKS